MAKTVFLYFSTITANAPLSPLSVRITKSASVNRIPPFRFSLEKEKLGKRNHLWLLLVYFVLIFLFGTDYAYIESIREKRFMEF
jgi:hypothetical protein